MITQSGAPRYERIEECPGFHLASVETILAEGLKAEWRELFSVTLCEVLLIVQGVCPAVSTAALWICEVEFCRARILKMR